MSQPASAYRDADSARTLEQLEECVSASREADRRDAREYWALVAFVVFAAVVLAYASHEFLPRLGVASVRGS